MYDRPSAKELIEAVRGFLAETAAPQLTGHAAFHARVAINALDTVARELEFGPSAETRERARLRALLETDGDTAGLNRALCEAIREGRMTADTPGLIGHLKATALDQTAIDQPKYSGRAASGGA